MPRKTMPSPSRLADVTIERRHITAFAELLSALGLGETRIEIDDTLEPLLSLATEHALRLTEAHQRERARADRLQAAVAPPAVAHDYSHHVQWRAVDDDEGVVIRGEWVPVGEESMAKQYLANEMVAAGRDDLHAQRLVRCNHFSITSIATPDDEPPPF